VRKSAVAALLALVAFPGTAAAAPVLFRARDGAVSARNDPYLNGPALTPAPVAPSATLSHARRRTRHRAVQPTVRTVLARLNRTHKISSQAYRSDLASFNAALVEERRLAGTRRTELEAITENLHEMAASGALTASRLPALFETLARNRQWWANGPLLSYGQRVEFAGSPLVWEYYPGQGIQLQVLGSFGKADGLYTAGRSQYGTLTQLLAQLIPLAARRAGGLAWEYYFAFDGGRPGWTSAMSQATGLEALTRAYKATRNPYYLQVAAQSLPIFSVRPPAGVAIPTRRGTRFVQYTFTPQTKIINAFLQTLIGLDDYARVSRNPLAARLFAAGNAEAQAEVPSFDTGAWSLYQPGIEDDLSYHELVTGFLQQLCSMTRASIYCTTAQHFVAYLKTPPVLQQLTFHGRAKRTIRLRFRLSKYSHVGLVLAQGSTTKFLTSASFPYGVNSITIPAQRRSGTYSVRIAATDLAGNFARITGTLQVSR
jgi:hypothetical protein